MLDRWQKKLTVQMFIMDKSSKETIQNLMSYNQRKKQSEYDALQNCLVKRTNYSWRKPAKHLGETKSFAILRHHKHSNVFYEHRMYIFKYH